MTQRTVLVLTARIILALLFFTSCAPAATAAPTSAPAPKEPAKPVTIKINLAQAPVPANLSDLQKLNVAETQKKLLDGILSDSTAKLKDVGVAIQIEQGPTRWMGGQVACQTLFLKSIEDFDLYLLDSSITLIAQKEVAFAVVPPDLLGKNNPAYASVERAYKNASGKVFGLPAATTPVMLIYNPAKIGVLKEPVTIATIIDLTKNQKSPIWVPEHGGIGMALTHSVLGDQFSPEMFFNPSLYTNIARFDEQYRQYKAAGAGKSASTGEILSSFMRGDIAWTAHSSSFLTMLTQAGYQKEVAVAQFPQVIDKQPGGSTIAWAWVVPAKSKNIELAWKLAAQMMNDPNMQRWFLLNGTLPVRSSEFSRLALDQNLNGFLPTYLLKNRENSIKQLDAIAANSPAWQVPSNVPIDFYNNRILVEGDKIATQIVNGTYSPSQAGGVFFKLLQEMPK